MNGLMKMAAAIFVIAALNAAIADETKPSTSGGSLDLRGLKEIDNELMRTAHKFHPGEVGDEHQTAILSNGKVSSFDEPIEPTQPTELRLAGIVKNVKVTGGWIAFSAASPGSPQLYTGVRIEGPGHFCTNQPLDNGVFTQSVFIMICFIYSGSPATIFDSSNILTDCALYLDDGVAEDSPVVARFRQNFPGVPVRRGKPR